MTCSPNLEAMGGNQASSTDEPVENPVNELFFS